MMNVDNLKFPKSILKEEKLDAEQIKQFLTIRADYEKSAFVQEGHFEVRALGPKEFVRPIPPGESAITALMSHRSGHVYGGTAGAKPHIFYYNPAPDADSVADIGTVLDEPGEVTALLERADESVLGVVNAEGGTARLFVYRPWQVLLREKDFTGMGVREIFDLPAEDQLFFSTIDPCHSAGTVETLPLAFPEKVSDMAFVEGVWFFLGSESGTVFCADDSLAKLETIGRLDPNGNFSPKFGLHEGKLYGAGLYGRIFQITRQGLSATGLCAPSLKGLELYNRISRWCSFAGSLYGATIDGLLFACQPEERKMRCLGKPTQQCFPQGMAASNGRLYILLGSEEDCAHLAVYDPETGDLRDLGCPLAHSERPWNGYQFRCMCRGRSGTLFLGEADRISYLFLYFPACKP